VLNNGLQDTAGVDIFAQGVAIDQTHFIALVQLSKIAFVQPCALIDPSPFDRGIFCQYLIAIVDNPAMLIQKKWNAPSPSRLILSWLDWHQLGWQHHT
jgi:hypothetical protein